MKVAIVGSRDFPSQQKVIDYVNQLSAHAQIISGGARGVDTWAEQAARKRGLNVTVFPAEWDRHGKVAGFLRNHDIVKYADRVVAFWDGKSRGTQHTMSLAKINGKPLEVIKP